MLNIKAVREAKGLGQIEVAVKSLISQAYLSELERGIKNNPGYEVLSRIAATLGVSVSQLLGEDIKPTGTGD